MSDCGLRPSFCHHVAMEMGEVTERLIATARVNDRCEVLSFPNFLCLRISLEQRRFWSPRLHLGLEPQSDGCTQIRGTYGPNANLWSSLLYAYLLLGSLGLFSAIYGFCQWSLGMRPWALWVFLVVLAISATIYLFARIAKHHASFQTMFLHSIVQQALDENVAIR
ncbi:MAG: hypothetical protein ACO3RV_01020 [Luteolibacter sp.]